MTTWLPQAACLDGDPELFFPIAAPGTGPYTAQVASAKAVCASCPVQAECLAYALTHLPHGVAGGLDELERATVRLHQAA